MTLAKNPHQPQTIIAIFNQLVPQGGIKN
jgi:hypothetical protein